MPESPFDAAIAALAQHRPQEAIPLLHRAGEGGLVALNLGLAQQALGRLTEAEAQFHAAAAALPGHPEPLFRLGLIASARGETALALTRLHAAVMLAPGHVPALAALAALAAARGDHAEATQLLKQALAVEPEEPELVFAAAQLALAQGDAATAAVLARRMLALRPAHLPAARVLAQALGDAALPEAAAWARAEPASVVPALLACCHHLRQGRQVEALAELRLAEALVPDNFDILAETGRILARLARPEEAEAALRAALALRPGELELINLLGTLMWARHRFAEMVALLEQAVHDFGPQPALGMNLALALNAQGRQDEALAAAEMAVARSGGAVGPLVNRMAVLPYNATHGDAATLLAAGRDIAATQPPSPVPAPRLKRGRLRLGVLSGGLGIHPVGWLTLAGLEALPEEGFSLHVYSLKRRNDFIATRFRARAESWVEVGQAEDEAIAERIRADGIDLLLEMGGYGEGGRPLALHSRPAPVQVKWVGAQFASTGLPSMDWMVTDRWETPAGFERFYAERLLRLPDGYICYLPPHYAPPLVSLPALERGHVTFGCFNNLAKLTAPVLVAWARILAALPNARLVLRTHALADPPTRALTETRLRAAGLPLERVALHGGCPHRELLAAYNGIDIALDPFPYTGGLTVCEALWAGVPVVSLAGDSFAGRHALSHCSNAGHPEWAATSLAEYEAIALALAADLPGLARLRAGLRAEVAASPLVDAARFGANFGAALRGAYAA
jgi:predicted O-linked N-acetylglucosamine transferase (SPINDLY family)